MKRKCPNCRSKKTGEMIIYKKDKETGKISFPPGPTQWICDGCEHVWEPGKRKQGTLSDAEGG